MIKPIIIIGGWNPPSPSARKIMNTNSIVSLWLKERATRSGGRLYRTYEKAHEMMLLDWHSNEKPSPSTIETFPIILF